MAANRLSSHERGPSKAPPAQRLGGDLHHAWVYDGDASAKERPRDSYRYCRAEAARGGSEGAAHGLRAIHVGQSPSPLRATSTRDKRQVLQTVLGCEGSAQRRQPRSHVVATIVRPCLAANSSTAPFTAPKLMVPLPHTAQRRRGGGHGGRWPCVGRAGRAAQGQTLTRPVLVGVLERLGVRVDVIVTAEDGARPELGPVGLQIFHDSAVVVPAGVCVCVCGGRRRASQAAAKAARS